MDIEKWLTDDMGFSADEIKDKGLDTLFKSRADKLDKGYLRLPEFNRKMDEVATMRADVAANNDKLTADMAEWAEMTASEKAKNGDLLKQIEAGNTKAYALEQKLIRVATEAGIDPKTVLEGEPTKKPEEKPVAFDPTPLRDQIGGVANYMLDLQADLPWIIDEHKRLTGETLDSRAFVSGIKADIAANKKDAIFDPIKRWEAQFKIPEKRTERDISERKAEGDRRFEEGRRTALSEAALPTGSVRPGEHAPVFRTSNVAGGSVLKRPQPSERLAGAVSALATGKYRQPATKAS